jgi:hypothetical protein
MIINQLIIDIKAIIFHAKDRAIRLADHERTLMYWHIGQRIFEEEQQGKDRQIIVIISPGLLPSSWSPNTEAAFPKGR